MNSIDVSEKLVLVKGSAVPFDVFLLDPNDAKEDLSIFDRAALSIRDEEGGPDILLRSTQASPTPNLSINVSAGKLTATLTQAEADALKEGDFVMDVVLRETAAPNLERHTDRIAVRIVNSWTVLH